MAEPVVDQSGIELQDGGSPTLPSSTPSPSNPISMRTPSFTRRKVLERIGRARKAKMATPESSESGGASPSKD